MSKIEWTDATWNPIIGCSKISPGCANCYAERMANRLANNPFTKINYWHTIVDGKWSGNTKFVYKALGNPSRWKKPRRIFVCSMSDLFHKTVKDDWLEHIFEIMNKYHQHTYQILTKRPERMKAWMRKYWNPNNGPAIDNLWLGVSAENQQQADRRIPLLLDTPAAVRWVSIEPMLGDIRIQAKSLDWVVVGGESGHKARPLNPDWVRDIKAQCELARTPFLFKQWGAWMPESKPGYIGNQICNFYRFNDGQWMRKVSKKFAGRELDGKIYDGYPK